MRLPAELYDSLRKRVRVFARQSKGVFQGDAEALHRTRVASRRLRELLPILRLDGRTVLKLDCALRRVTKRLGAVRDLDVLMMLIEELRNDRRYSKPALDEVQASVEDRRAQARDRLKERLSPAKLQKISRRLKRVTKHLEAGDAGPREAANGRRARETSWAVDARCARRAARVREAIDAAGIVYAAGPLHQLRIALKKFRFALELKAQLDQNAAVRDITALKSSQDLLGRLHDLQVLVEHARDIQATRLFADPAGWRELGSLVRVLERDCRTLHARYVRDAASLADLAKGASQAKNRTARVA